MVIEPAGGRPAKAENRVSASFPQQWVQYQNT